MNMRAAFEALPDHVVITDPYLYVIDYNRAPPWPALKKGRKLTRCVDWPVPSGPLRIGERIYRAQVSSVMQQGHLAAHILTLSDVTQEQRLIEQQDRTRAELDDINRKKERANRELSLYAQQASELADASQKLRISRSIHDDAGHALTVLHTLSRMCLGLWDKDPPRCQALIEQGLTVCERAMAQQRAQPGHGSVAAMLAAFAQEQGDLFDVSLSLTGEEPPFAARCADALELVCKEAYHNTLCHSMADRFYIEAAFRPQRLTLDLYDNGRCRGGFEKGFGLAKIESALSPLGGRATFRAPAGEGFCIHIELEGGPSA